MKAGRPTKISTRVGWTAVIVVMMWLAGVSSSAVSNSSCCKSRATTKRPNVPTCCDKNEDCGKFTGCDPGAPLENPAPTAVWPKDLSADVPPNDVSSASRIAPPTNRADNYSRTGAEPSIPAELRLGSALWSHAPPTHIP